MGGEWPDRPDHTSLTDPVWNVTLRCWDQDPAHRPTMAEVVKTLRAWRVFSLFEEPT